MIENTSRGIYQITQRGLDVLKDAPDVLNNQYLKRFPEFQQFLGKNVDSEQQSDADENTPEDTFAEAFEKMNDNLADEILDEVMRISPVAFEKMILDLFAKMGYGAFENAGRTTSITGDEGIDGIIMEDKLGFDLIYIQAKNGIGIKLLEDQKFKALWEQLPEKVEKDCLLRRQNFLPMPLPMPRHNTSF